MTGALTGLRVLDLSRGMSGSWACMFLADNGAEVIRVEPPDGDPLAYEPGDLVWNRGKRSAVFDLDQDDDKQAFLALAARADVLVESFSPGTM